MAQKVPLIWSPSRKMRPFSSSDVSISLPPLSNSPAPVAKGGGGLVTTLSPLSSRLNECPLSRRHRSRGEGGAVGRNLPQSHLSPPQNTSVPNSACSYKTPFPCPLLNSHSLEPWLTYCKALSSAQKERSRLGAAPEVVGSEHRPGAQRKEGTTSTMGHKSCVGAKFFGAIRGLPPPPSLPPSITNARSVEGKAKEG